MRLPKIIKHALDWTSKVGARVFSCVQVNRSGDGWTAACTDGSKFIEVRWHSLAGESDLFATQALLDQATGHKSAGVTLDAEALSSSLKSIDMTARKKRRDNQMWGASGWRDPLYREFPYELTVNSHSARIADYQNNDNGFSMGRADESFPEYAQVFCEQPGSHAEIDLDARQLAFVVDAVRSMFPHSIDRHARVTIKVPMTDIPFGTAKRVMFFASTAEVSVRAAICELLK
jgi:hypothetical protein